MSPRMRLIPALAGATAAMFGLGMWAGEFARRLALDEELKRSRSDCRSARAEADRLREDTREAKEEADDLRGRLAGLRQELDEAKAAARRGPTSEAVLSGPKEERLRAIVRARGFRKRFRRALFDAQTGKDEELCATAAWVLREDWPAPPSRGGLWSWPVEVRQAAVLSRSGLPEVRLWGVCWLGEALGALRKRVRDNADIFARQLVEKQLSSLAEKDPDAGVRAFARVALAVGLKDRAGGLIAGYRSAPADERKHWLAAFHEFRVGADVACELKSEALAIPDEGAREAAYRWMLNISRGVSYSNEEKFGALRLSSPRLRMLAAEMVIRHKSTSDVVAALAKDPLPAIRRRAFEVTHPSASRIPDYKMQILGPLSRDKDPQLRRDVLIALAPYACPELGYRLRESYTEALKSDDEALRAAARTALARWGRIPGKDDVLEGLRSADEKVQQLSFRAAAKVPGTDVIKAMLDAAGPERGVTRHTWLKMLREGLRAKMPTLKDDELDVLMKRFLAGDRHLAAYIASALGSLPGRAERLLPYMREGFEDDDPGARAISAAWAVRLCGNSIRPAVGKLAADPDVRVRLAILNWAEGWPADGPVMAQLSRDAEVSVRRRVVECLAAIESGRRDRELALQHTGEKIPSSVPLLAKLVKDGDKDIRRKAILTLLRCPDRDGNADAIVKKAFLDEFPPVEAPRQLGNCLSGYGASGVSTELLAAVLRQGDIKSQVHLVGQLARRNPKGAPEPMVGALLDLRDRARTANMRDRDRRSLLGLIERALKYHTKLESPTTDAVRRWLKKRSSSRETE